MEIIFPEPFDGAIATAIPPLCTWFDGNRKKFVAFYHRCFCVESASKKSSVVVVSGLVSMWPCAWFMWGAALHDLLRDRESGHQATNNENAAHASAVRCG